MRILFLSNLYPPNHLGGMELRCRQVVEGLQSRGHTCLVLTSRFVPPGGAPVEAHPQVRRTLHLEANVTHYRPLDYLVRHPARLRSNLRQLQATVAEFRPDIVFVWGMWNLSPTVSASAEKLLPDRVVYSFADYWPIEPDVHEQYWRAVDGSRWSRDLRRTAAPVALSRAYRPIRPRELQFQHAIACSQFVLDKLRRGLPLPQAAVVFSGIDVDHFVPTTADRRCAPKELRVIYAGAVVSHKGIHTAVDAVHALSTCGQCPLRLAIVGSGHPTYVARLRAMVAQAGLESVVRFEGAVPRTDMPGLLQCFDILVLPTITDEPLSRAVMEAMACGLVVVATRTGGTPEMIDDGVDGLLFDPGDSEQLADRLRRVAADRGLRQRLSAAARRTAVARFRLDRMMDEIESYLQQVPSAAAPEPHGQGSQ
jgi:glycosyltransferase involved in cell wall biosynthesis